MTNNETSEEQFKFIFLVTRSIRLKSQRWGQMTHYQVGVGSW
jgi:hypothetical protein